MKRAPVAAFVALALTASLGAGTMKIVTNLVAMQQRANALELGLLAAAQNVGVVLMALPAGIAVDYFGARRSFIWATLFAAAVATVFALAATPWSLVALTLLLGLCFPFRLVAQQSGFLTVIRESGASRAGWLRAAQVGCVFMFGPLIGGRLVDVLGATGAFLACAGFFLLAAAPGSAALEGSRQRNEAGSPRMPRSGLPFRTLLRDPDIRGALILDSVQQAANSYWSSFIMPLAVRRFHHSVGGAAEIVALQGGAYLAALTTAGWLLGRTTRSWFLAIAVGASTAGLITIGTAPSVGYLTSGSVALGLGTGAVQVWILTRIAALSSTHGSGRIAGVYTLTSPAGAGLGSLVGGVVGQHVSIEAGFLLLAPVVLIAAGLGTSLRGASRGHEVAEIAVRGATVASPPEAAGVAGGLSKPDEG